MSQADYRAVISLRNAIDEIMRQFDPIPPHILEHLLIAYNLTDAWIDEIDVDGDYEP